MRILVTGATGFLGSQIVNILSDLGHDTVKSVIPSESALGDIVWDMSSGSGLPKIGKVDAVIHCGAIVSYTKDFDVRLYETNALATLHIAQFARDVGAHFVFTSTIGVHGYSLQMVGPSTPIAPDSHYGMSKLVAERAIESVCNSYSILRIGGMYGLNGPSHLGLNNAISRAVQLEIVPTLSGDGVGRRNYVSVADAAKWIIQAAVSRSGVREVEYVGSWEILSIRQYLQAINEEILGSHGIEECPSGHSRDSLVTIAEPPIAITSFREYLRTLKPANNR